MKWIVLFILSAPAWVTNSFAQAAYEFSFAYNGVSAQTVYKVFYVDHNNSKGQARFKFTVPGKPDSLLVNFDIAEETATGIAPCFEDMIFLKLLNPVFIESRKQEMDIPAYICLKKDSVTGLYEPAGMAVSVADCNQRIIKFSSITAVNKPDLTKDYVLRWFKVYDAFYRNIFVTNNARDLTTSEKSVKLYLLFAGNVTDTLIGAANSKDMYDAIKFFGKVKDFLGISSFIYDTLTRDRFNKQTVLQKIDALRPADKDIVVFYYAGHGFRQPKDGRPGPYIDLRDIVADKKKDYLENSLSLEDIATMIRKKGARLNLIISDCCNDNVTVTNPIAREPAVSGKKGLFDQFWSMQKCRDLFLNANPSTITAAAASPYQLAISNPEFGGYFSNFFINTLESNLSLANSNPKISWDDIFVQVKQQTETKSRRTWCNDAKTVKCNQQRPVTSIQFGRF